MVSPIAIGLKSRIATGVLALLVVSAQARGGQEPPHSADLDALIVKEAQRHGIPESLVRRVVQRESRYNPRARNHSFWGLMQISYPTARSMGFKGTPEELLNPVVNLTYAVPYLANAFVAAGKRQDAAVRLYARGYYETARQRGLLGVMRTAASAPVAGFHEDLPASVAAAPQPDYGIFGALIGPSDPPPTTPQLASADTAPLTASPAGEPAQTAPVRTPAGTADNDSGDDVAMVIDKKGRLEPPKKWIRDGGVTVLARGEQAAGHVGSAGETGDLPARRKSARLSHKSTAFASMDVPNSAQAYAAETNASAAAPQAAIAQAVSSPDSYGTAALQAADAPEPVAVQEASGAAGTAVAATTAPAEQGHSPRKRREKTMHRLTAKKDRPTKTDSVADLKP